MASRKLRMKVFQHYGGPICVRCGSTNFDELTMDHLLNNGSEMSKKDRKNIYGYIVNHNYPPEFQVLCKKCNQIKRREKKGWLIGNITLLEDI